MKNAYSWATLLGFILLGVHVLNIADDVRVVMQDPNRANKPQEVLKLAFDVSRYLG